MGRSSCCDELSEIESSSRLRHQNGAIHLSAPLVYRAESNQPLTMPVGFLLTRERLITVRFEELTSFNTFINRDLSDERDPLTSGAVFARSRFLHHFTRLHFE